MKGHCLLSSRRKGANSETVNYRPAQENLPERAESLWLSVLPQVCGLEALRWECVGKNRLVAGQVQR